MTALKRIGLCILWLTVFLIFSACCAAGALAPQRIWQSVWYEGFQSKLGEPNANNMPLTIYTVYTLLYIYIYIECAHTHTHVYIYIYNIYIYINKCIHIHYTIIHQRLIIFGHFDLIGAWWYFIIFHSGRLRHATSSRQPPGLYGIAGSILGLIPASLHFRTSQTQTPPRRIWRVLSVLVITAFGSLSFLAYMPCSLGGSVGMTWIGCFH